MADKNLVEQPFLDSGKMQKALHDIHDYKLMSGKQHKMLVYILSIPVYLGINLALFGLNFRSQVFIEEHYYLSFHLLEFWAVFAFTMIEAFVLISTDTLPINGTLLQRIQIGIAFFNILFTLIIAIIFTVDPHEYEVATHYMEYSAQVPVTLINFVFVLNFKGKKAVSNRYRYVETGLAVVTCILSILQFLVYSDTIETSIGGERSGHFIEFTVESLNAAFVLWFSSLSYLQANRQLENHFSRMHELL